MQDSSYFKLKKISSEYNCKNSLENSFQKSVHILEQDIIWNLFFHKLISRIRSTHSRFRRKEFSFKRFHRIHYLIIFVKSILNFPSQHIKNKATQFSLNSFCFNYFLFSQIFSSFFLSQDPFLKVVFIQKQSLLDLYF